MGVLGLCCCMQAFFSCGACTSHYGDFSNLWLTDYRGRAQQLWCKGLVALQHVESSLGRDQTCVHCIGKWILNHYTIRKDPSQNFKTELVLLVLFFIALHLPSFTICLKNFINNLLFRPYFYLIIYTLLLTHLLQHKKDYKQ